MNRQNLVRRTCQLLSDISRSEQEPSSAREQPRTFFMVDSVSVQLSGTEVAHYNELTRLLLGISDWNPKFSMNYIQTGINRLVAKVLQAPGSEFASFVEDYFQELDSFQERHEVILPVEGLRLDCDRLSLGNVTFGRCTPEAVQELVDRVSASVRQTRNTPEEQESHIASLRSTIGETIGAFPCFAVYEVLAEPVRARQRAIEEADRALDLLRFAAPYVHSTWEMIGVGLPGNLAWATTSTLVFSPNGSFDVEYSHRGSWIPFHLTDQILHKFSTLKIFELSDLLQKSSPTDFERRILSAVRWCSRAQVQSQAEFRVLCLMTSLECILNPRQRPVRMGMAEAVALFIGHQSLQERGRLRDFILEMYDHRSSISHGGHPEISDHSIRLLYSLAGETIYRALELRDRFETQKQLDDWLAEQRLVGSGTV